MGLFTQPGDRAVDGLLVGLGQLFALLGWATVAVGMSAAGSLAPVFLLVPAAGAVAGMLQERSYALTLGLEVILLAACSALVPPAGGWIFTGAAVLGVGRIAVWIQRRRR